MGKAVPRDIKSRANELMGRFSDSLSPDFEKNKEFLNSLSVGWNKSVRNLIAGYITKKMKS